MNEHRDDYAVVVGIDRYPALGQALSGVATRARAFADWLILPEGGGLPAGNVTRLLPQDSASPIPSDPQLWQIHRALADLGVAGGAWVGRRLYACFAGCAVGSGIDDLVLLAADAGQDGPAIGLGLCQHVRYLQLTGAFEELVLVADVRRIAAAAAPVPLPPPFPKPDPRVTRNRETRKLLLVGDAFIPDLLVILREEAARDPAGWHMEASDLVHRCQSRVGPTRLWAESSGSVKLGMAQPNAAAMGQVTVAAPHWAAQIRILDGQLRTVTVGGSLQPAGPGRYVTEIPLPEGVYTVEASLGGTTKRKSVVLAPGADAMVDMAPAADAEASPQADAPTPAVEQTGRTPIARLDLASAAPLADTFTAREWHTCPAIELSGKSTWTPDRPELGGDSGLFVFVRTLQPERFEGFADGLSLLGGDGQHLVAFSGEAVEGDAKRGWLAFNAQLRPWSYILRRERRLAGSADEVRVRHQPIHLSPGWTTQIFLSAERYPSMGSMFVGLVPRGAMFDPTDRAAAAAQVLLDAMGTSGRAAAALSGSPALLSTIREDHVRAPWLAVLASHALRTDESGGNVVRRTELLDAVMGSIQLKIGDHPDVRALRLTPDGPPPVPFDHPPMLRASLKLVLQHAIRWADTVPAGSLTGRVATALATHSPWTAWRELEDLSIPAGQTDLSAQLLQRGFSPRAPIFPIGPGRGAAGDEAEVAMAASIGSELTDLKLVKAAQSVITALDAGSAPPPGLAIDSLQAADMLAHVKPQEVSAKAELPLAAVERLERLRRMSGQAAIAVDPQGDAWGMDVAVAQTAIREQRVQASAANPSVSPAMDDSPTIEDCVRALRDAAAALRKEGAGASQSQSSDLSSRLGSAADALLGSADLVAITDTTGNLRYINGALRARIRAAADPLREQAELETHFRGEMEPRPAGDSPSAGQGGPEGPLAAREVVRSAVEAEGTLRGYVAVSRERAASPLTAETLCAIDALLPRLTLHVALRNGGPSPREADYAERLRATIADIEKLVFPTPGAAAEAAKAF